MPLRVLLFLPLMLLLVPGPAGAHGGAGLPSSLEGIRFVEGDLEEVRERAVREGKMLFVHFTAEWCLPCRWMEQETYPDTTLAAYINEHFLALKLDIDRSAGQRAKQAYQVVLLPSMLVFDPYGRLVARYEESLTPEALLTKLRRIEVDPAPPVEETAPPPAPDDPFGFSRPVAPDIGDPLLAEAPADSTAAAYTLQLGVFGQFENAQREAERVGRLLGIEATVQPGDLDGRSIYRVLLGRFAAIAEAEAYRQELADRRQLKGVVKALDSL